MSCEVSKSLKEKKNLIFFKLHLQLVLECQICWHGFTAEKRGF